METAGMIPEHGCMEETAETESKAEEKGQIEGQVSMFDMGTAV